MSEENSDIQHLSSDICHLTSEKGYVDGGPEEVRVDVSKAGIDHLSSDFRLPTSELRRLP